MDDEKNLIIEWAFNFDTVEACNTLVLQGFTFSSLVNEDPAINSTTQLHDSTVTKISSEQRNTLVYRIVALNKDGSICSDYSSQINFHKLNGK